MYVYQKFKLHDFYQDACLTLQIIFMEYIEYKGNHNQRCKSYLSFLVPPKPNIKFPRYIAGNGHSCNTHVN